MPTELTRKEAIKFLDIPEKHFDNYFKFSCEFRGFKKKNRWYFNKKNLHNWKTLRKKRTVFLNLKKYETCFEFAIKMAYSNKSSRGGGIRGFRSEVQMADDYILGILAEHGLKKFLKNNFNTAVKLDTEVHPDYITPQDIVKVKSRNSWRTPKLCIAVKSSKVKSCFNVISSDEYKKKNRKSDIYIFARVGLPSDHLFRILRKHSFFKNVRNFLATNDGFRKIDILTKIPIWICGYSFRSELKRVKKIPGQEFSGYRYVKSVAKMHNSDRDWKSLIRKF